MMYTYTYKVNMECLFYKELCNLNNKFTKNITALPKNNLDINKSKCPVITKKRAEKMT